MTVSENEIQLFREVVQILNQQNIYYWLDQGSLLGSVRDGHFIPWDHDVDIGMTVTHQQVQILARELIKLGGTLECYPYVLRLMRKKEEKSVDMRIYTSLGDQMTTQLRASMPGRKTIMHRIGLKLTIYGQRASSKIIRKLLFLRELFNSQFTLGFFDVAYSYLFMLARLFDHWRHFYRQRIVYFSVPSHYFCNLNSIDVHGLHLPIPSEVDGYLQMKYGNDWRVPNKSWKYWLEDGAISSKSRT